MKFQPYIFFVLAIWMGGCQAPFPPEHEADLASLMQDYGAWFTCKGDRFEKECPPTYGSVFRALKSPKKSGSLNRYIDWVGYNRWAHFVDSLAPIRSSQFQLTDSGYTANVHLFTRDLRHPDYVRETFFLITIPQNPPFRITHSTFDIEKHQEKLTQNFEKYALNGPILLANGEPNSFRITALKKSLAVGGQSPVSIEIYSGRELVIFSDSLAPSSFSWLNLGWRESGKRGLMLANGRVLVPPIYDRIHPFGTLLEGFAEIESEDRIGLIDLEGNVRLPVEFTYIFPTGIPAKPLLVRKGEKVGWVDTAFQVHWDSGLPDWLPHLQTFVAHAGDSLPRRSAVLLNGSCNEENECGHMHFYDFPASFRKLGLSPIAFSDNHYYQGNQGSKYPPIGKKPSIKILATQPQNPPRRLTLFSQIEQWIFASRADYFSLSYNSVSLSEEAETLARTSHFHQQIEISNPHLHTFSRIRQLPSGLIEVRYANMNSRDPLFLEQPAFRYFDPDGSPSPSELHSAHTYPFTDFALMDSSYLKGNFILSKSNSDYPDELLKRFHTPEHLHPARSHYSLAEIERMVNDLSLESSPTATHVHNLRFLTEYLRKMQDNTADWIHWDVSGHPGFTHID